MLSRAFDRKCGISDNQQFSLRLDLFVETLLQKHNSAWSGYIQEQQLTCMCSVNTAREAMCEGKLMKGATQRVPGLVEA